MNIYAKELSRERVHYTQDKNAETEKSLSLSTERQCERDESSSREEKEEKGNISNTATNKTCRCVWYLSRVCAVLEKLENNKATLDTHLTTCLFGIWPQGICETTITTTTWYRLSFFVSASHRAKDNFAFFCKYRGIAESASRSSSTVRYQA